MFQFNSCRLNLIRENIVKVLIWLRKIVLLKNLQSSNFMETYQTSLIKCDQELTSWSRLGKFYSSKFCVSELYELWREDLIVMYHLIILIHSFYALSHDCWCLFLLLLVFESKNCWYIRNWTFIRYTSWSRLWRSFSLYTFLYADLWDICINFYCCLTSFDNIHCLLPLI